MILITTKYYLYHKKNSKKECFVTDENHNLEFIIDKVNNYIDDYDDTPDGKFSIELAVEKELSKRYKYE